MLLLVSFVAIMILKLNTASFISSVIGHGVRQTLFEMEVEDNNSVHKIDNHLVRRLIVLPLTEAFNPSQASGMHGKVQYGDKCSLPASIGKLIFEKPYEVPWLFEISPVRQENQFKSNQVSNDQALTSTVIINGKVLTKAFCSPLDFRSPENYIFLPRWLMNTLNVTSYDLVDISFVRIKMASLIVFQPLTNAWDELVATNNADPKTILEQEVNKYSSLTAGSTIAIEVSGKEIPLYVKETIAEGVGTDCIYLVIMTVIAP